MSNTTVKISPTAQALSYDDATREALSRLGHSEISDEAARAIAMAWQSPGTVGRVLASLASGVEVTVEGLHADIHATRKEAHTQADRVGLDMLATWAMNR